MARPNAARWAAAAPSADIGKVEGGFQIVVFEFEHRQQLGAVTKRNLGFDRLDERQEVLEVEGANPIDVTGVDEPSVQEMADRLEEAVARRAARVIDPYH